MSFFACLFFWVPNDQQLRKFRIFALVSLVVLFHLSFFVILHLHVTAVFVKTADYS